MKNQVAFVGDVHGCLSALRGISSVLQRLRVCHTVFLGDYINKGPNSAEVVAELLEVAAMGRATLLSGNHERALIAAIDGEDLATFLRMGGASTIRSYVRGNVGPNVLADFRAAMPREHVQALRELPESYELPGLVAAHAFERSLDSRFRVSAHVNVGPTPALSHKSARIDTGCGQTPGRLTALLWPSLRYVQVDENGAPL